jgi:hypothetical protein
MVAPKSEFKVGDRVRHPRLGEGDVLELYPFGEDTCAVISFSQWGQKKIILKYVKLEPVKAETEEPEGGDEES